MPIQKVVGSHEETLIFDRKKWKKTKAAVGAWIRNHHNYDSDLPHELNSHQAIDVLAVVDDLTTRGGTIRIRVSDWAWFPTAGEKVAALKGRLSKKIMRPLTPASLIWRGQLGRCRIH